ncbi:MAG: hypothetical protein IJ317_05710 [Clostridia bacterium]|nr:hypothetical protein [Clostridia bacterium]
MSNVLLASSTCASNFWAIFGLVVGFLAGLGLLIFLIAFLCSHPIGFQSFCLALCGLCFWITIAAYNKEAAENANEAWSKGDMRGMAWAYMVVVLIWAAVQYCYLVERFIPEGKLEKLYLVLGASGFALITKQADYGRVEGNNWSYFLYLLAFAVGTYLLTRLGIAAMGIAVPIIVSSVVTLCSILKMIQAIKNRDKY